MHVTHITIFRCLLWYFALVQTWRKLHCHYLFFRGFCAIRLGQWIVPVAFIMYLFLDIGLGLRERVERRSGSAVCFTKVSCSCAWSSTGDGGGGKRHGARRSICTVWILLFLSFSWPRGLDLIMPVVHRLHGLLIKHWIEFKFVWWWHSSPSVVLPHQTWAVTASWWQPLDDVWPIWQLFLCASSLDCSQFWWYGMVY